MMKRSEVIGLVLVILMGLLVPVVNGETSDSIPLPKELGVFFGVENNQLIELEQNKGVSKTKGGTGAFFSALATAGTYSSKIRVVVDVPGQKSPVRVSNPRQIFVLKTTPGFDFKGTELVFMKSLKKVREVVGGEAGGMFGMTVSEGGYATVALGVESHPGDPLALIFRPKADLVPGEYCFSPRGSNDVQCFGVDGEAGEGGAVTKQ